MDPSAWTKPAAPAEPAGTSPSAVVEPCQSPETGSATSFVYNPWKLKELRRIYINLADGSKIGYLDLSTKAAVPESSETSELLQRALAELAGLQTTLECPAQADPAPCPVVPTKQPVPLHWFDLSENRPGQLIEDLGDASYKAGVAGEQRTAGVLAGLEREGYQVLHSVPLSPRKDIDHLVIGPTGIHAINTKATSYEVTAEAESVYSDGYRQKWIESLTRDAGLAADYLTRAARMDLQVQPLVVVWSSIRVNSSSPFLVPGEEIRTAITTQAPAHPSHWTDVVFNVARRSDTWTSNH